MSKNINKLFDELTVLHTGLAAATPLNVTETSAEKRLRIKYLQQNPEEWFKYYFISYCLRPDGTYILPAQFHIDASLRVLDHPEWYEVRNWSRDLAKSTRTMMEVLYLILTGKKKSVILASNSEANALRLMLPYRVNLECNNRIINDYGQQQSIGSWEASEFITRNGVVFRVVGAGQSPRGRRTDVILIDDMDTDEDCRNPDIIDYRWKWVEEALIPTRDISTPLLIIFCGNVIAEDCCVVRAAKNADKVDVINIRDQEGHSSWPQKNSEDDIDRVLSLISESAKQKEYFNNPMATGRTFPEIKWGACPPLKDLQFVVCYNDPSPSNKDHPGQKSGLSNSRKASFVVGRKGNKYYIYTGYLDSIGSRKFIDAIYANRDYINGQVVSYFFIENNTLQDPVYSQIYLPLIYEIGEGRKGGVLNMSVDDRKKLDKWFRIEATMEPINTRGDLIFNIEEKNNPHMLRLEAEMKAAKPSSKMLDGIDCVQGAVVIIDEKSVTFLPGAAMFTDRTRSSDKYY